MHTVILFEHLRFIRLSEAVRSNKTICATNEVDQFLTRISTMKKVVGFAHRLVRFDLSTRVQRRVKRHHPRRNSGVPLVLLEGTTLCCAFLV
ncbi:hypothetical protein L5515_018293 [Caenorhabditis briggsae]|uniref:Uncharacterized protein n=1 Tax=Caenorhabditis briggsae TaxID=6238 RepID=A0AAE9JSR1_CAEBR|nr:hypothetical protein L5515_018293 [Caenorhabditis briggsae]